MYYKKLLLASVLLISTIGAFATNQPIEKPRLLASLQGSQVGVVMSKLPRVDASFPGASCLPCIVAAVAENNQLIAHARRMPTEILPNVKNDIAELLRKKGIDATVIGDDIDINSLPNVLTAPNISTTDYSPLRKKYPFTKLVLVSISNIGIVRSYESRTPTGEPKGGVSGHVLVVNLETNRLELDAPFVIRKESDGEWDEPPSYPRLTKAYAKAIEGYKETVIRVVMDFLE